MSSKLQYYSNKFNCLKLNIFYEIVIKQKFPTLKIYKSSLINVMEPIKTQVYKKSLKKGS